MIKTKNLFHKSICLSWKNLGQNSPSILTLDCFNPQEISCHVGGWGEKENSEILAISNQYKNTLDDLIDSSDSESLDWARIIDVRICNTSRSEVSSADLLEGNYLDEDVPNKSLWLMPKTGDSRVHQRHVVTSWARYRKSCKGGKDCRLVIRGSGGTEASI